MSKRLRALALFLVLLLALPLSALAHSGRTDGSGGHKDKKNKSGLGSYHYHCGGHPPHLHTDGCPYKGGSGGGGSKSTPKPTATPSPTPSPTPRPYFDAERLPSGSIMISSYYGYSKNAVVPEKLDNREVTAIGEGALDQNIKSVVIPESVTAIAETFSANPDIVIIGTPGSFAHEFALAQGYTFETFLPDELPLAIGSKDAVVAQVQRCLIDLGYLKGSADGIFGKMTKAAVEGFQDDHSLEVTGSVDAETYSLILFSAAGQ